MRRDAERFSTRLLPSPWFQVALVVAGGAVYTLALVRRGLSPSDIETLDGAGRLLEHLPGSAPPQTLATDHPFAEWLLAFLRGATGVPMETLWVLGTAVAAAAALPAVWQLVSALERPTARWSALAVFAAAPSVVAASSASFPAALALATWSWVLVGLTAVRRGPFERVLEWSGWGIMIFVWPPAAVWLGLWLLLELTTPAPQVRRIEEDDRAELSGLAPRPRIALGDLMAPLAAAGLMSLVLPGFHGSGFKAGWESFLQHALNHSEGPFWFAGFLYSEARPPLWSGLELFVWSWPAAVGGAALVGWGVVAFRGRLTREGESRLLARRRRRSARLVAWCLPFLWLVPWLTRHSAWGSIDVSLMAAPIVALATGIALDRLIDTIDNLEGGPSSVAWLTTAAAGAVVLSTILGSVRTHPLQGSFYNGALGGLPGAVQRGHQLSRDDVLPVDMIQRLAADKQVYAIDERGQLRRYVRFNWIPDGSVARDPGSADVILRPLVAFGPGDAADSEANRAGPDLVVEATAGITTYGVDGFPVWLSVLEGSAN
jgi:hypothetical protein